MKKQLGLAILLPAITCLCATAAPMADPWADNVELYIPGEGIGADFVSGDPYSNVLVALGEPTRYTSEPENFGGAVTPLNGAFRSGEVVSIGRGGSLTVSFDQPVTDDPLNPYGIDLLIFGNAFYFDADYPNGVAGTHANEGGVVEVSEDGVTYHLVPGVEAEGLYPTLGYADLASPFSATPGAEPTDFTRPVNPAFNPAGLPFSEIVQGYQGSGGGVGVDLAWVGLSQISYVRISTPSDALFTPEIDALADVRAVPAPAATSLLAALLLPAAAGRTTRRYA